ncbi:GNAT family N-acetyltransferase [Winogradskyella sp. SM1960]|uniref:GNAT family N-acetyltransferase n=1 Tax=Winogradskyella sp. SM1960 TaxID=2865955 RepID=UPI001CD52516|nr:GNAT family N-acetyltransferase [Winogradskyella sp. SM1960]
MIEVLKNKDEWRTLVSQVEHADFYHTYDYHQLSKKIDEEPILLAYKDGNTTVAIPFLLRKIKNSSYKDVTSVYGYAGPLTINLDEQFDFIKFHKSLNSFFKDNKIIAVFSRLHPFIDEKESVLEGLGHMESLGKVVYIDLNKPLKDQRASYNRRLKTYLNKSRKLCTVIEGNVNEHLESFIQLYTENMKRIDADDSYFFSTDYFHQLLTSDDIDAKLLLCRLNETQEDIAGAIFIKTGDIVQYHLSGLNEDYFELNPIKLIIDEKRIQSTLDGFRYLNLGGGRGSKEDSLFRFKRGFSKDFKSFKIWKHIVDEENYIALTENHLGKSIDHENLNAGYFPAYRAPITSNCIS